MGIVEQITEQLTQQMKDIQSQISIEMIESAPDYVIMDKLQKTFMEQGFSEDDAWCFASGTTIEAEVIPENIQAFLTEYVKVIAKMRNVLEENGANPALYRALTAGMSISFKQS